MREIPLTRGAVALVDDADYEWLSLNKWYCSESGYAVRGTSRDRKQIRIWMHREVVGCPSTLQSDHVDGNTLNNQRANLRVCSPVENHHNRAPRAGKRYKGIDYQDGRWRARITVGNKNVSLGMFGSPEEAALAYDVAAVAHFGSFARLNFPRAETPAHR